MDGDNNDDVLKKEEAIKNKIRCKDYISARSLLFEALKTYPRLENASEMLIICEVLCSAQMALHRHGVDWYWMLQLFHLDKTAAVERQYRNLVAQLEPVKNDLPGATLALKLLNDAYSVLSDPEKRAAFNAKRNRTVEISSNSHTDVQLTGIACLGVEEFSGSSRTKRTVHEQLIEEHGDERNKKNAKMKMICADELSLFMARIISKDSAGVSVDLEEGNCSSSALHDFYDFEKDRKIDLFEADQIWAAYDQEHMPRRYAQVIKMDNDKMELLVMLFRPSPQSYHEKRWCDSGLPAACGTFILEESKKITAISWTMFSHLLLGDLPMQPLEIYPKKGEAWAIYRDWDVEWCSDAERRKRCVFEIVEILTDYMKDSGVKVAYMVKVDGYKNVLQRYLKGRDELSFQIPVYNLFMVSHKVPAFRFVGEEIDGIANGMLELDPLAVPDNLEQYFPYSQCFCSSKAK